MNRKDYAWAISFIYIAYLFIGQVPFLKGSAYFNTLLVSLLLIIAYPLSSILLMGSKKSAYFFIIAVVISYLFELMSLNTGMPFGRYTYANELGVKIGQLPVFIPLLWASIGFYSYRAGGKYLMPFLMVALDLSFDPRYSGHLWIWISKTQYFGDPWLNFLGWFITSAVIIAIFSAVSEKSISFDIRAVIFYTLFGLDNCISDIYAKLFIPAFVSFSIFLILAVFLSKGAGQNSRLYSSANSNQP